MLGTTLLSVFDTQSNFILAALCVCALTAATLALLLRNAEFATQSQRLFSAFWVAAVTGVGVWTTHFVAMIGYRPDAALTYDLRLTMLSILVGVTCVGLPVAAATLATSDRVKAGLGIAAGLGAAAMHLTGMTALENCAVAYNPFVLLLGTGLGIAGFVWALMQDAADPDRQLHRAAGFVGGVCGLHFVAMASVTLDQLPRADYGVGGSFLSILVLIVSLGVFAGAMVATFNHRRKLALLRAGV